MGPLDPDIVETIFVVLGIILFTALIIRFKLKKKELDASSAMVPYLFDGSADWSAFPRKPLTSSLARPADRGAPSRPTARGCSVTPRPSKWSAAARGRRFATRR